jgi:hypothetical protein
MPASLYRLANKPHHTEAQVSTAAVTPEPPVQAETIEEPMNTVSEEPAVEPAIADDPPAASAPDSQPEPVVPTWDPAWTKTQLLDVATQLGLEVTSANTKAQIIEALTAATSS